MLDASAPVSARAPSAPPTAVTEVARDDTLVPPIARRIAIAAAAALAAIVLVIVVAVTALSEDDGPAQTPAIERGQTPAEQARNLSEWLRDRRK